MDNDNLKKTKILITLFVLAAFILLPLEAFSREALPASGILESAVYGEGGAVLGKVHNIYVNPKTGMAQWTVIEDSDALAHDGGNLVAIPFEDVSRMDASGNMFVGVPYGGFERLPATHELDDHFAGLVGLRQLRDAQIRGSDNQIIGEIEVILFSGDGRAGEIFFTTKKFNRFDDTIVSNTESFAIPLHEVFVGGNHAYPIVYLSEEQTGAVAMYLMHMSE
jgi:sporulation protein YlmC with PRC-barrel domain